MRHHSPAERGPPRRQEEEQSRKEEEELEAAEAAETAVPAHPSTTLSSDGRRLGKMKLFILGVCLVFFGSIIRTQKVYLELTYLNLTRVSTDFIRRKSAEIQNIPVVGGLLENVTTVPFVDQPQRKWNRQREGRKSHCSRETWCMFIKTKLYGNHSKTHRSQTLNWFEDVNLESTLRAVQIWVNQDEKEKHCIDVKVYYLLENLDAYAGYDFPKNWTKKSKALITTATFNENSQKPSSRKEERYRREQLQANNCSITSSIRIDADDMFDNFISDLVRGYLSFMKRQAKRQSSKAFNDIIVHGIKSPRMVYWSDSGCEYRQPTRGFISSLGQSVTCPVSGYLQSGFLYRFNPHFHNHVLLFNNLQKHVKNLMNQDRRRLKIRTQNDWIPGGVHFVSLGTQSVVYLLTPLSSHWNHRPAPLQRCKFLLTTKKISGGVFKILENARSPHLSILDQRQNAFFNEVNGRKKKN